MENYSPPNIQTQLFLEKREINLSTLLNALNKKPWISNPYKKQTWGSSLHSIAPYVGRMKPALAHWLIRASSKPGDIILDPFCGIGTVPLEADLLNRYAIGVELNPYALLIARAKFDRRPLEEQIQWLRKVQLNVNSVDLSVIPDTIKQFYDGKTLRELFSLKEAIEKENNNFLKACLIAISHGHRPQYLSSVTGYIVPYKYAKNEAEYKAVIPRMIQKVTRMYKSSFPLQTNGEILDCDAKSIPLKDNSVDVIISSPPYYSTIDYVDSNRLRLALLGVNEQKTLKTQLIQNSKTYIENMAKAGAELWRVLKPNSLCILVLGDFPKGKNIINTAKEISLTFSKIGFTTHDIIADEIPIMKRTVIKWAGAEQLKLHPKKYDRILVMSANKS